MTMDFSDASKARATLSICEDDFEYDESSSPFVKVSSICCAVVTVHLPDMTADSVQSVCEVRACVSVPSEHITEAFVLATLIDIVQYCRVSHFVIRTRQHVGTMSRTAPKDESVKLP